MKKILFDQSTFDKNNRRSVEKEQVLRVLSSYDRENIYLIKEQNEQLNEITIKYIKEIINYSKEELRKNPIGVLEKIYSSMDINSLSDLLVISSDQEFLYLFNNIPVNTCLIYKNKLDCMEMDPTYEFKNLDKAKKLILNYYLKK